ncbi:lysophospholipid acyltransferase family protein [Rhizobium sp. C1]|uniref:lysophospholipid acyltransferase family protein n=1 Tax=Rhizobium sp. C1 TaxID=1349799 RepID=UPI001E2E521A|nr:lysophospholipid acyltransferase family protein [Rhizobium sp. C1]MCD2180240.1 1-acyl-sn-glycerol-3-phosphate acyltransferase [Rhizobium sp. C1]
MIVRLRIAALLIVVVIVTLFMAPLQVVALRFDWRLRRRLPGIWHRIACALLGVRIHVNSEPATGRPLMIAANHSSWLDILVLSAVADVVFIAKSEVKTWPVFNTLARLQATIFIEREERRKTGDQVNEIGARLAAGEIVVLFPEGTTSDGNRLLPVKTSLFGAASAALPASPEGVVLIQPVAVAYTRAHGLPLGRFHRVLAAWPGDTELVPHLSGVLKMGSLEAEVTFCPPIPFSASSNRKAVSRLVEEEIGTALHATLRSPR